MKKIHCTILTPERYVYEGDISFAVVQAHDGEMGFLVDHSPIIAELGAGELRLSEANKTEHFIIEGGIVEVKANKMIVLAERAFRKNEIVAVDVEKRIKDLQAMTFEPYSAERFEVQAEISTLKKRIKVAAR